MITGANVTVRAPDGRALLSGLSFELGAGDRLAFSGPNGCGKSTLLRTIAGLENNCSGIALTVLTSQISYLPTRPLDLLLPWCTVRQVLELFSTLAIKRGIEPFISRDDYGRCFGYDLSYLANKEIYRLSSGQQALLAILCAVIQNPSVLVADEIFSTLAGNLRLIVAHFLKQSGISILCATHDTDFIQAIDAHTLSLDSYIVQET